MGREEIIVCLEALRRTLLRTIVVAGIASVLSFFFSKKLALLLIKMVHVKVYYFTLPEVLFASVELAIYCGIFLSVPVAGFIGWREFRPFLEQKKIHSHLFAGVAIVLFYIGSLFCLVVALPNGISFLLSYEGGAIKAMISIKRLIAFCVAMMFGFGFAFELPLALLLLSKLGIVTSRTLAKGRRYAVLFIVIAASVITPTPDVYNMSLLAVPLYVLYELGLLFVRMSERRANKSAALS
jgi:sec-independent protein translocase protein TatC